jgi:hypothetical protein
MTKLTIKIDENISLTGTIVTEEDDGMEEYDVYYYQPECPFGANCEYAGNVLLPMESNITSNVAPPPGWKRPKAITNQWSNRNIQLGGNLSVSGNIDTLGCYNGVGSLTSMTMLPSTQPVPTPMSTGRKGEIAMHNDYVYLCIEPYTWVRWSIERTW